MDLNSFTRSPTDKHSVCFQSLLMKILEHLRVFTTLKLLLLTGVHFLGHDTTVRWICCPPQTRGTVPSLNLCSICSPFLKVILLSTLIFLLCSGASSTFEAKHGSHATHVSISPLNPVTLLPTMIFHEEIWSKLEFLQGWCSANAQQ